jgi:hypothetical protein
LQKFDTAISSLTGMIYQNNKQNIVDTIGIDPVTPTWMTGEALLSGNPYNLFTAICDCIQPDVVGPEFMAATWGTALLIAPRTRKIF